MVLARFDHVLPLNLHHTAIAVRDLDATLRSLAGLFGVEPLTREVVAEQGVEEAMVPLGGSYLQVLMPLGSDTAVGRFLERRGEGLHHVAIQVADLDAALAHLVAAGAELVDREARAGGGGHRIAFVHPRALAGTLIELVEVH
ncbi:MAG: methylmalonyl-CoA epimerase [Acidimicrobiia bacterium]|nr:methylmalonyl-CoA epimerase [Acidimicrobiia bacterium]